MANITVAIPVAQEQRVATAFGRRLGLQSSPGVYRDATGPELNGAFRAYAILVVFEEETAAQRRLAEATITLITPT